MHEDRKKWEVTATGKDDYKVSGRALVNAARQFRRMTMRALDYLPPGEISFADYGRAIIAPDQAAYPDDNKERDWLCDEFVRRRMVRDRSALVVDPPPEDGLEGVDLQGLMDSDWAGLRFRQQQAGPRSAADSQQGPPVSHRAPASGRADLLPSRARWHADRRGGG